MECSVHKIKEYIDVDISVVTMDEGAAIKFCEETAKLIGEKVSNTWKIEITNQTPAEHLQERYYCTITYEVGSKKVNQDFSNPTKEELEKTKRIAEFLQNNFETDLRGYGS